MSTYVTLSMRTDTFDRIINNLMSYCSTLDDYYEMEDTVHLIDYLDEEYSRSMEEQDKEYKEWQEYEKLFLERFENPEFLDNDGNINEKGMYEYKNFNKVNNVLKDYKECGTLDILDSKQNFFLVLDLLNAINNHGEVFDLLNSQSTIIADLEKENKQLKEFIGYL